MGFWSSLCSGVKNIVSNVVDKAKNIGKKAVEVVKSGWQTFTGQKDADKAKEVYESAKQRYEEALKKYGENRDIHIKNIDEMISKINQNKIYFMNNVLKEYLRLTNRILEAIVQSKEILEKAKIDDVSFDRIREIEEVIKIDFQKNKILNNFKAVFTLGFLTRSQARESLEQANKESAKVDLEISKMKAEIIRLKNVEKALENINIYFEELIELVEKSNSHLDFSLNQIRTRFIIMAKKIINGKQSIKDLPIISQNAFMLSNTLIKVLIEMSKKKFIENDDVAIIKEDENKFQEMKLSTSKSLEKLKNIA